LRLESTGRADPGLLLRAARVARADLDFAATVRLAEASLAAQPSAMGGLLLGEALHNLGSFERAEEALATAMQHAADDDLGVLIAAMRGRNLFFGLGRGDEAVAVEPGPGPVELLTCAAEVLAFSGRPLEALAMLQRLDDEETRVDVLTAVPRAAALAMTGRTAAALELSQRAHDDHVALDDLLGTSSPGFHRVNALAALVYSGRLTEAAERGRVWFDLAVRARLPVEVIWLAVHLARGALAQGLPVSARRWAERAVKGIDAHPVHGLRPIAIAVRATADGLLGNAATAAGGADEVERMPAGFGCFAAELHLARAWALVAAGDQVSARDVLLAAATDAERSGLVPAAGWLLHDAVRLGAVAAIAPLADLAASTDSQLVHLRADHAAALVAGDGHRLSWTSERFESLGAVLLAAEAAAQAASTLGEDDRDHAGALDTRATRLAACCEGATTPVLVRARTVGALSDRERDIAVLAAEGHSSRLIADRLSLSVRTIDNHLGRIYAKLGVSGRVALAAALALGRREDEPA
jgi:DNA-binding CsgD family transcriptional regulator